MKKFTKLFLSCAAVAAVTAAVATSAMAAEVTVSNGLGTYDTETGKLTVTAPADIKAGTQATLLVYEGAEDATTVTQDSVVGIDQEADAAFTNTGLKDKPQAPAEGGVTYTVMMGYTNADGAFGTVSGTFLLGEAVGEEIVIGDVDGNGRVIASDANAILWYGVEDARAANVGKTINLADGTTTAVGDVDNNGRVIASDANAILWYGVDDERAGNVGTTVTGTIVDAPAAE